MQINLVINSMKMSNARFNLIVICTLILCIIIFYFMGKGDKLSELQFAPIRGEMYQFHCKEVKEVYQAIGGNKLPAPLTTTADMSFTFMVVHPGDFGMATIKFDSFSMTSQIHDADGYQADRDHSTSSFQNALKVLPGSELNVEFDRSGHVTVIKNYQAILEKLIAAYRQDTSDVGENALNGIFTQDYFIKVIEKATAILPGHNGSLNEWTKDNPFQNSLPFPVRSTFALKEIKDRIAIIKISGEVRGTLNASDKTLTLTGHESGDIELYSNGLTKSVEDRLTMEGEVDFNGIKMKMMVRNKVTVRGQMVK